MTEVSCRFCGARGMRDELVKYSVRHHAHFLCYLASGKDIARLNRAQLGKIPYQLTEQLGLWPEIKTLMEKDDPDDLFSP